MPKLQKLSPKGGYSIPFAGIAFSPADTTTYYIGSQYGVAPASTAGNVRLYVPFTGTVVSVYLLFVNATSNGTAETSTINLRLNNSTDTAISSAIANDVATAVFSNANMSVAVAAGDYLELKWVTPAWVTNPAGLRISGTIGVRL